MPINSVLIGAAEFSATAEEVQYQIQQHQAMVDESAAEKRKEEYGMEFEKNAPDFVVPPNTKGYQVNYLRERFTEQRDAQKFSYSQAKEEDFQKEFESTRKEKEKEIVKRMAWLEENAKGDPALQKELNNFRNYGQSDYSADNAASQIAMLGSRDPQKVERGVMAQQKVNFDLVKYGNATAADMETINVMRAATVMIPKYSADDLLKRNRGEFAVGSREEKSLSNEELAAQNLKNAGSLTVGKADPKLLNEPSKLVAGKETNENLGRDNLANEMDAFDKIYKTSLLDPDAAARAHADADMQAAHIDPNGYSGMIIDKDGVSAAQAKSVAENLGRNWKALANDKSMSFAERNKEAVTRSIEDGNVTPQNTNPAEFLAIIADTYKRVQLLRDAGAQAAITTSTLRNAEMQANAYEGIVGQMNELVTSSAINPDMMLAAFEKSYKTGDAMSIAVLVNGPDKMKMLDSLNMQEFRQGWANTAEKDKFNFFADRVLDVMMDSTRNLKDDNQLHSMAVVRRMREANANGKLGGEPIVAHMLNTMYQQFLGTGGKKLDEQAAMEQADLQNNATGTVLVAGKLLTVAAGRGTTEEGHAENIRATQNMISLIAQNEAGANKVFTQMGMMEGMLVNPNAGNAIQAKALIENIKDNPVENKNYAHAMESEARPEVQQIMTVIPAMTQEDMRVRARVRVEDGETTPYTTIQYMREAFGKGNKYGKRIADYIEQNKNLHRVANALDPVTMESLVITAMDGIQADVTHAAVTQSYNATKKQAEKVMVAGITPTKGLPDDLPSLDNRSIVEYPNIIKADAEAISEQYIGTNNQFELIEDLDRYKSMVITIDESVRIAVESRDGVFDDTAVPNENANDLITKLQEVQKAVHDGEDMLMSTFSFIEDRRKRVVRLRRQSQSGIRRNMVPEEGEE